MKKVTVILTTFNSGPKILETVNSILNQDGVKEAFELELVIIDDCSTDDTCAVLDREGIPYSSTGSNSGGPNKGRNIGLKQATGDYICIADHDDVWEKHRIIAQLKYIDKAPIVTSGFTIVDTTSGKKRVKVGKAKEGYLHFAKNDIFFRKLTKSYKGHNSYLGSIMFRKELSSILFEEFFGMVDYDWVIRLFHERDSIEVCDSLYNRYVEGTNLSLNEEYRKKDFYYSLMSTENYFDRYPSKVREAQQKIYGSRARFYYVIKDMKKSRLFLSRSGFSLKNVAYYITSYVGHQWVNKHFNVFG